MALKRRSALQEAEKLVARGRLEAAVKQLVDKKLPHDQALLLYEALRQRSTN